MDHIEENRRAEFIVEVSEFRRRVGCVRGDLAAEFVREDRDRN